jgi:hypothetical protein
MCSLCYYDEAIKHLLFQYCFARSIWSVIQFASILYPPPRSLANIFRSWLHGIDYKLKKPIRVEAIAIIWSLRLCTIKCLMIKTLLFCRLFTGVSILSVYYHLYSVGKIKTCLWRLFHGWRLWLRIIFPIMDGQITCASVCQDSGYVHPSYVEAGYMA